MKKINNNRKTGNPTSAAGVFLGALLFLCAVHNLHFTASAQIASGGNYKLEKSVIANGGTSGAGASAGGNFSVEGAIGQFAVGVRQQNSPFTLQPGFWTGAPLAPTAAAVDLGGRVMTATGRGIRNVRLTLTLPDGTTRSAVSSAFGYYRFTALPAGETYILFASAKRFTFAAPMQVVNLFEERDDVDFVAEEISAP
ncbi:MAG TPA: carboxypeptidase-like regulatory domain-containing protein [Pyrinomonadaceae bacterium]|jgi:hypothetical protein